MSLLFEYVENHLVYPLSGQFANLYSLQLRIHHHTYVLHEHLRQLRNINLFGLLRYADIRLLGVRIMYDLFTYLLGNKHANYNNWVALIKYSQNRFTTYYITTVNMMCTLVREI